MSLQQSGLDIWGLISTLKSFCLQTEPQIKCLNQEQSRKRLVAFIIVWSLHALMFTALILKCYEMLESSK